MQASQENAVQTSLLEAMKAAMDEDAAMDDCAAPLSTSMIGTLRTPFLEAGDDSIKIEAQVKQTSESVTKVKRVSIRK